MTALAHDLMVPPGGLSLFRPKGGQPPDWWMPLYEETWIPAAEADHMRDDDPVSALLLEEGTYALPWWVMKNHHVANLEIEGIPVLVTLCEACSGSAAFVRRTGDATPAFQIIGSYRGTHCLADYDTQSIWTSFTGRCLFGVRHGQRLRRLPLVQSSWGVLRGLFPDAVVAEGAGEPRDGHGAGHTPGSREEPLGRVKIDERRPFNELVLGVAANGASRAYPLDALAACDGVLNDVLGGAEIVVLSRPETWLAIAFERRAKDRSLTFERRGELVVDSETGSAWSVAGAAVSGPLAGARLALADCGIEEWYVWAAYHPKTGIFVAGAS